MKHIYICLMVMLLAGCASQKSQTEPTRELQRDEVWQLVSMRGRQVKADAPVVTLSFNPEAGTLRCQTACNSFAAYYTLAHDGTLRLSDPSCGTLRCPEADMNAEARLVALLNKADRLEAYATVLILYQGQREILKFGLQ